MENARPDESVKLKFWGESRNSMHKEMVVKVLSDGEKVVIELFNLLVLS